MDENKSNHEIEHLEALDLEEIQSDIEEVDPSVLEGMSLKEKEILLKAVRVTSIMQASHYSGPLPRPEDMEKYNQIIPNGADRIMQMAEKQNDHRISIEKQAVAANNSDSRLGQIFAFILALFCIGSSVYLGMNGQPWLGGVLGGSTLVALATVFIVGRKLQKDSEHFED
ncbi:DUF2335 domain-containing protein [Elizabethkingia anophelis]|nr:DUF2335 domain-containing protein [Elizabethkingia anophelis]